MSADGTHVVAAQALGAVVDVSVADGEVADAVRRLWAPCLRAASEGGGPRGRVSDEDLRGHSREEVLELLTQRVTIEAISLRAGELLMFHACALANAAGDAVVMVGPSGVGKTTLAQTHGRRWGYVTDETAALTTDDALLAFPKPLSVSRSGRVKAQVSQDEAGLVPAATTLRVRAVLLLDRVAGATGVTVEAVPTVPAIALLAEHTSYLARLDRPLARIARLLHGTGGLRRVCYGDASDLEPLLTEVLGPGAGVSG